MEMAVSGSSPPSAAVSYCTSRFVLLSAHSPEQLTPITPIMHVLGTPEPPRRTDGRRLPAPAGQLRETRGLRRLMRRQLQRHRRVLLRAAAALRQRDALLGLRVRAVAPRQPGQPRLEALPPRSWKAPYRSADTEHGPNTCRPHKHMRCQYTQERAHTRLTHQAHREAMAARLSAYSGRVSRLPLDSSIASGGRAQAESCSGTAEARALVPLGRVRAPAAAHHREVPRRRLAHEPYSCGQVPAPLCEANMRPDRSHGCRQGMPCRGGPDTVSCSNTDRQADGYLLSAH